MSISLAEIKEDYLQDGNYDASRYEWLITELERAQNRIANFEAKREQYWSNALVEVEALKAERDKLAAEVERLRKTGGQDETAQV